MRKKEIVDFAIIAVLIAALVYLAYQNAALTQANDDLQAVNEELTESNMILLGKIENITDELQDTKKNYTLLMSYFAPNPNPVIETRLGAKIIERPTLSDNYLWVTGEIVNTENVTVYNTVLNFTLYTIRGVDTQPIVVGTMEPHQVVSIRTDVETATGKIINWSSKATATFLP